MIPEKRDGLYGFLLHHIAKEIAHYRDQNPRPNDPIQVDNFYSRIREELLVRGTQLKSLPLDDAGLAGALSVAYCEKHLLEITAERCRFANTSLILIIFLIYKNFKSQLLTSFYFDKLLPFEQYFSNSCYTENMVFGMNASIEL